MTDRHRKHEPTDEPVRSEEPARSDAPERSDADFTDLEDRLRQDRLDDPGDLFFARLQQQVMQEVEKRPAPRRETGAPLVAAARRHPLRYAALGALAAALLLALGLLLMRSREARETLAPKAGNSIGQLASLGLTPPAAASSKKSGRQWLREQDQELPVDSVADLDKAQLPTLVALLRQEASSLLLTGDEDDQVETAPTVEAAVDHLNLKEMRAVYQALKKSLAASPRQGKTLKPMGSG
jgi:hypothetical protein